MTLPTLQVLLDDGTGTFPYDISRYVHSGDGAGYQITRGRDDWQGEVTAGELTLTLNNSDGRFTPGSTILGTPSPIKVDARIRVLETVGAGGGFGALPFGFGGFGGGGAIFRFTGYVKSWPVAWPATVTTFSTVDITATDAQARAERRTLRSMLEEEILLRSPTAYYMLGEAEGSTSAGDSSGGQAASLIASGSGSAVALGVETGLTDGFTGAAFSRGQYLAPSTAVSATVASFGCVFSATANPTGTLGATVIKTDRITVTVATDGTLLASNGGFGTVAGPVVTDGLPHLVVVTSSGTSDKMYLGGVLLGGMTASGVSTRLTGVGGAPGANSFGFPDSFAGVVSHVFTSSAMLAALDASTIAAATLDFAGETADARIARITSYAGLPTGALDASQVRMPAASTAGASAQSAMQDVADAALGLVFIDSSGALGFHDGVRVPSKTVPDLILSSQWVTPDVVPTVDDQQILNYIEATSVGTGATSVARNQASDAAHGRYPEAVGYLVRTDAEALDRAAWTIANFAEPTARFGALTINLYGMPATLAATVVSALDLDCWLQVTMLAAQNPGGSVADVVVQGWQANVTPESWTITCNVVARSLFNAFIADDPVFGIADSALARAFV